jgi:hypothetical protein
LTLLNKISQKEMVKKANGRARGLQSKKKLNG